MLHFAGVWWAFVFPLGMYSAASYAMAVEIGQRALITVAGLLLGRVGGVVHCGRCRSAAGVPRAGQPVRILMPAARSSSAASARMVIGSS